MRPTLFTAVLTLGILAAPIWGQATREADARDQVEPRKDRPMPRDLEVPVVTVKACYLGVATSPAPKALRHQVQLPDGVGLVVDAVAPESPAAAAGLQQHDLLHKLNEQLLINPQQLAVLVRTFKADETIKLTIIRAGKPVELSAKLVERDLPPLDQLRLFLDPRLLENRDDLLNPPGRRGAIGDGVDPNPFAGLLHDDFTISMRHRDGTITITSSNRNMIMIAKDKDGKELFKGPIDTPEQRKALPSDLHALMTAALGARNRGEPEGAPKSDQQTPPAPHDND